MKRLASALMVLGLVLGLTGWFGTPQPAVAADMGRMISPTSPVLAMMERRNAVEDKLKNKFGEKIDLNNANVRTFARFPGMYPTIAGMILRNSPFDSVEEVYDMPGLTDRQIEILDMHKDKFIVTPPETAIIEGDDRFNNGIYDDVS